MINFGSSLRTPERKGFGKNFRNPKTVAKMHNSGSPGTKPTISVRLSDAVPATHASSDTNIPFRSIHFYINVHMIMDAASTRPWMQAFHNEL
jgi:hypothetical protein